MTEQDWEALEFLRQMYDAGKSPNESLAAVRSHFNDRRALESAEIRSSRRKDFLSLV